MKRIGHRIGGINLLFTVIAINILAGITTFTIGSTLTVSSVGLIGFWRGEGDATDVANGNDGLLVNGTTFDTGVIGQAFKFDGYDDGVVISESTVDLDGYSALTLAAWINVSGYIPDASGSQTSGIITKYSAADGGGTSYTFFLFENGSIGIYIAQDGSNYWILKTGAGAIQLNTWTHVAGTWQGGDNLALFVNGNPVVATLVTEGSPTHMSNNSVPVNIGRYHSAGGSYIGPSGHFDGLIDEARIYSRALDSSEVQALYQSAFNQNPVADAGPNRTVECAGALTQVQLDGTNSSDPDGDTLSFEWSMATTSGGFFNDPTIATPIGSFPPGPTLVTLTVTDGKGGIHVTEVLITVIDTTPPVLVCSTNMVVLWPPNHQMVAVEISLAVSDNCSQPEALNISCSVSCNEPDDAKGDGKFKGDVNGFDGFTAPVAVSNLVYNALGQKYSGTIWLRAERDGAQEGRKYSIVCNVIDTDENTATASCVVIVPHNKVKN